MTLIPPDQITMTRINGDSVDIKRGIKEIHGVVGEFDGLFGGYGWADIKNIPIPKILSRDEKHELRTARALYRKGDRVELYRKYGTTNMEIVKKVIHAKRLAIPREVQKTRYGERIVLSQNTSTGKALPSARVEEVKR